MKTNPWLQMLKSAASIVIIVIIILAIGEKAMAATNGPLTKSTVNPRYFQDASGNVVCLTGSHTWNNLQDRSSDGGNLDYTAYINFLVTNHHNFMRTWEWECCKGASYDASEVFNPVAYARSSTPGAADGGNKFDVTTFNQSYFDRLRSRVITARDNGIYVSIMLFEGWTIYDKGQGVGSPWFGHPYNPANNINGINGDTNSDGWGTELHDSPSSAISSLQFAYVEKVIETVKDLDNVLYEVSNEDNPSSANTSWQAGIINHIKSYETSHGYAHHPVGMTYQWPGGSTSTLLSSPADWISPGTDSGNYASNPTDGDGTKVVLTDTDHLFGLGGDGVWVWKSYMRGLNPVFMDDLTSEPSTDFRATARQAMGEIHDWSGLIDLKDMTPQDSISSTSYCLAYTGQEYLAYQVASGGAFTIDLSGTSNTFAVEWFDVTTAVTTSAGTVAGGGVRSVVPPFSDPAVLHLKQITSGGAPVITTQPVPQTYNVGDQIYMNVNASGSGTLSYQWYHNGVAVGSPVNIYYKYPAATSDAGLYKCVVSNSFGSTSSATVQVTVGGVTGGGPVITSQPGSGTYNVGDQWAEQVNATGTGTLTYQWYHNGVVMPGETFYLIYRSSIAGSDAGTYYCVVTDSTGSTTSNVATVTVLGTGPTITAQPSGGNYNVGGQIYMSVSATGSGTLTYQWYQNGTALSGQTLSIYYKYPAATTDSGNYYVVVTDSTGSTTSQVAVVTVN